MESYKEAFLKFTSKLNLDFFKLEEKSLNDIKEIKSIYKVVTDMESINSLIILLL